MSLPIEQLAALGLSQRVVDAWSRHGIRHLLPLQEKALAEYGFLHGKSLLVFAPTSSGKTFVAEMAALKHLEQNRRVVYLVPTKALAEEKYRTFSRLYRALGCRVAVATRERPDTDGAVLAGRYDLLVAVYEKMKAYLVSRPEMLSGVALVVVDEVQTLGEPGRGATLDLLLSKIRGAPYGTQLIGLSAVLGEDAQRLADWLGCDLMIYRERPVELREGALDLATGTFHYRAFNTGERGEEPLEGRRAERTVEPDAEIEPSGFQRDAILSLAEELAVRRNEQALVFVPTRYDSRNWAHHLASRISSLPSAADALDELDAYEDTHSRDLLAEVLAHGVAFHNADLSWDLRALIEEHFNRGAIRILISTSTLGQGVNLRGRNVLHVPAMVATDRWTGRHAMVALSRARFRNQGGRGARFSRESRFGRSILVARNEAECERLLRDYVEGDLEPLEPQIAPEELDLYVLDLVASRVAPSPEALVEFFHGTFSGRTLWQAGSPPVARHIAQTVESLLEGSLLAETQDGKLAATGLGEVAAATGLQPRTVVRAAQWLREGPRILLDEPLEALLVLAATPDGRDFPAGPLGRADSADEWVAPLRERLLERAEGAAPAAQAILNPEGGFTREMLADFRKTLALDAWIGPGDTREIEERFGMFSGTLANLASHVAWLVHGTGALARALALAKTHCTALERLGQRLVLGCAEDGCALRQLRIQGLSRTYLQTLLREGYASAEALAEADEDQLAQLIPHRIAHELKDEARRVRDADRGGSVPGGLPNKTSSPNARDKENNSESPTLPTRTSRDAPEARTDTGRTSVDGAPEADSTPSSGGPLLEIDSGGSPRVKVRGKALEMPPTAFRLLEVLAEAGVEGASYEQIGERLWPGVARKGEVGESYQPIHNHRARLLQALAEVMPKEEAALWIAVERGKGMSLTLRPEQIRLVGAPSEPDGRETR